MQKILIFLTILLLSGCLENGRPQFDLADQPAKLDFNPLSFEILKIWNKQNLTTQEVQLDSCNVAHRKDTYVWEVQLAPCA